MLRDGVMAANMRYAGFHRRYFTYFKVTDVQQITEFETSER